MFVPTLIMGLLATILVAVGYYQGNGAHLQGLKSALTLTVSLMPLLVFAFVVAGMIQVLIPASIVSRWVGPESGFR